MSFSGMSGRKFAAKIRSSPLKDILKAAFSLSLLCFLFTQIPMRAVAYEISRCNPILLLAAFAAAIVSIMFDVWRWAILLNCLGYRYRFALLFRLRIISFFFNVFVPGGVGGDIARIALLPTPPTPEEGRRYRSRVTAAVVMDRVVGMAGLMLLALVGLLFAPRLLASANILPVFILLSAGIALAIIALFNSRVHDVIRGLLAVPLKLLESFHAVLGEVKAAICIYRSDHRVFKQALPICVAGHFFVVCIFAAVARSLEIDIDFLKLLMIIPLVEFVSTIPISLGGIGIRELSMIVLLTPEGVPKVAAMSISLLFLAVLITLGILGGVLFLFRGTQE